MLSIHFVLNSWLTKQVDPGDCGKGGRVVVGVDASAPFALTHLPTGLVSARQELTVFSVIND